MWRQRDRAYQFLRRRLVSADANHPVSPSKTARPQRWARLRCGPVIIEKDTGARFVLGEDGAPHPVLWVASARLRGVPGGDAAGITGASDSLLGNDGLLAGPWTRCIGPTPDCPAGDELISAVLLEDKPGGQELPKGPSILARLRSGELFLLAGGMRHPLVDDAAVVVALEYASAGSFIVVPQWLNAVLSGRDLRTIDVVGSGARAAYPGGPPRAIAMAASDVAQARTPVRGGGYPVHRPAAVPLIATVSVSATGERITIGTGFPLRGNAKPHLVPGLAGAAAKVYVPGGSSAVKTLGCCRVARPGVPAPVLALFPTGPTLEPGQARRAAGR